MLNKVHLIGRLGSDPEVRRLDNDKNVARLNVATYESFKKQDGTWDQQTEWHNVIVWNRAQSIEKMRKGNLVYVEGKLKTRSWEDNGVKKYSTEIVGIVRVCPKSEGNSPNGGQQNTGQNSETLPPPPSNAPDETDDLPF